MIEIDRIEGVIARRGPAISGARLHAGRVGVLSGARAGACRPVCGQGSGRQGVGDGHPWPGLARHGSRTRSPRQADRRLARSRCSAGASARPPGVGHLPHPCACLRRGDGRRAVTRQRPESSFPRRRESGLQTGKHQLCQLTPCLRPANAWSASPRCVPLEQAAFAARHHAGSPDGDRRRGRRAGPCGAGSAPVPP